MTRYTLGTLHKDGIGQPAMIEAVAGKYMLVSDHHRIVAGYKLHNELLLARLKRAEGNEE